MTTDICLEMDSKLEQGFPSSLGSFPGGSFLVSALQLATVAQLGHLAEVSLEKLSSAIHTVSKVRVRHGKRKKWTEELQMFTRREARTACLNFTLMSTLHHLRSNTVIFHKRTISTFSGHSSIDVYSKHGLCTSCTP
ncbi:unnamed protein product [Tetraodon nigroviridis]|uniref:Chromosome 5 SCAF14581, whole genome shotgun sequence n=1 Tax=Tetraodon nigroviridis TaxID=99883 RepID=Q4SHG1_TETNG|nr:unnamed protein product [Tetraodon nigroviridis]